MRYGLYIMYNFIKYLYFFISMISGLSTFSETGLEIKGEELCSLSSNFISYFNTSDFTSFPSFSYLN